MESFVKTLMPLAKLEFTLFKLLIQLEQTFPSENRKILFNLQISGGKDSMCLLNAFATVLTSKIFCKLKNSYTLIVQHFNHKQRGQESDEDSYFVAEFCLKNGIPIYINSFPFNDIQNNKQNVFRDWRKKEAQALSKNLMKEMNADKYFIVTAHHARDHVETVLLHLLRGSGISGLNGITIFDATNTYFRPFYNINYQQINDYVAERNIHFREDSSNVNDKYKRNYIRQHILPHFEHLQPNYENSFVKLSQNISSSIPKNQFNKPYFITEETTTTDLFYYFKSFNNMKNISENCLINILHEAKLLLQKKQDSLVKEVLLNSHRRARLSKKVGVIEIIIK